MELEEIIKKAHHPGPTFFQLFFFVIGKEPTAQAKLYKCIEEIKTRRKAIESACEQIDDLFDSVALHNIEIKKMDALPEDERDIRVRQVKRKIKATEKHVDTLRENVEMWDKEIKFLKEIYEAIEAQCPLRDWAEFDVQFEYWNEKIAQEVRQRLIMNAPVDVELIKTAMALPDAAPIKKQLMEYVETTIESTKKALTDK